MRTSGIVLPDCFIRRGDEERITHRAMTDELLDSRERRLAEGSALLNHASKNPHHQQLWEGQYVAEAEFILFRNEGESRRIRRILQGMFENHSVGIFRMTVLKAYFGVATKCCNRAYLLLRIARRLAMRLLPRSYFLSGSQFESATLPDEAQTLLRQQLLKTRWVQHS
ncbi:MAG: hypothetical protein R3C49_23785 [Planctomycetaceae bacterium]